MKSESFLFTNKITCTCKVFLFKWLVENRTENRSEFRAGAPKLLKKPNEINESLHFWTNWFIFRRQKGQKVKERAAPLLTEWGAYNGPRRSGPLGGGRDATQV